MSNSIIVSSSRSVRSFLPLDRYGIEVVSPFHPSFLSRLEKSDTTLFSLLSYGDYKNFCSLHKSGLLKGKKTVVGGAFLNLLKRPTQLLDYFAIDHLCVGKGERFIQSFCEGSPLGKVYHENRPVSQFDILIDDKGPLKKLEDLSLLLNYRCRWNRCLFCHHAHDGLRKIIDDQQLKGIIEIIRDTGHVRKLRILDNDVDIEFIAKNFLDDERLMSQLEIVDIFGVRCTSQVAKLEEYVRRYSNTLFTAAFGLEFVTQFFLDLYQKGYNLERFLDKSRFLFDNRYENLKVAMYCLVGMPLMDREYYSKLSDFISEYRHIDFRLSYFLMDDAIMANFNGFDGLEVLDNINTGDFNGMQDSPNLDTIHRHFLYRGMSQCDHFKQVLEPSGLLRRKNAGIHPFLYPFVMPGKREFDTAMALSRRGEYESAIIEAKKATQLGYCYSGNNVDLFLGYCYEKLQKYDRAIVHFEKVKENGSGDYKMHFSLARCYSGTGQKEKASHEMKEGYIKFKARSDNAIKQKTRSEVALTDIASRI